MLNGLSAQQNSYPVKGVVPDDLQLKCLFSGGFFLEGPAVAGDGKIYFSDITFTADSDMQAGHIWCYNPQNGETKIYRSPSGMANGIVFDAQGRMVVAEGADYGGRRITRTDMSSGKSVILAGSFQNKPLNSPNDLVIDSTGRIYFTDPRYVGHEKREQECTGVFRLDPDGKITLLISDLNNPNGIALSPDGKTLYVACFDESEGNDVDACRAVNSYDLSVAGQVKFRKRIINVFPGFGVDGITVDDQGNIYITSSPPAGISIFSPDGQNLGFIATPDPPSNLTFGQGEEKHFLYITAVHCLYSVRVNSQGFSSFKPPAK